MVDDDSTRGTMARRPPDEQLALTLKRQDEIVAQEGLPYVRVSPVCEDCRGPDFGYMLRDDLWASVRPASDSETAVLRGPARGCLCLRCAEVRLRRRLEVQDFSNAVVNLPILFGLVLGSRSARGAESQGYPRPSRAAARESRDDVAAARQLEWYRSATARARAILRPGDRVTRRLCTGLRGTLTFTGWDGDWICGSWVRDCAAVDVRAVNGTRVDFTAGEARPS